MLQFGYGILIDYGWLKAFKQGRPIDALGNPVPWITYPCIDFLKQLDFSEKSVFEWGSGQSTLFWSARAKSVVSIEAESKWYELLKRKKPSNCALFFVPREVEGYVKPIEEYPEGFDIIVIDGPGDFRPACAKAAIQHSKPGGIIILDNSDQSLISAQILRESGRIQVDFTGFVPSNCYAQCTSIFFDRGYSFQPLNGIQPQRSVAQPNAPWPDA